MLSIKKLKLIKELHGECFLRFRQLSDVHALLIKDKDTDVETFEKLYQHQHNNLSRISKSIRRFKPQSDEDFEQFKEQILSELETFDENLDFLEERKYDGPGFWNSEIESSGLEYSRKAIYIANILKVAQADGEVSDDESDLIQQILKEIRGSADDMSEALHLIRRKNFLLQPVGVFSEQVRNIEDMLRVCLVDNVIADQEKELIETFADTIHLEQEDLDRMYYWLVQNPVRIIEPKKV